MCEVTWNTWGTCERSWCQCTSPHVLKILCFSWFLFLLSVGVVVLWLVFTCQTARTLRLKFESPFTPTVILMFHEHVLSVSSDLFDLSIHFISLSLHLSYLPALPAALDTFYFLNVVDNMPAHFRWGAGPPGQKKLLHTSCHTPEGKKEKWIDALRRSSDRPTMENCKDQNGTITYIRAIQGQSRGAKINPFYFLWQGYRWIGKNTHSTRAALPTTNQS